MKKSTAILAIVLANLPMLAQATGRCFPVFGTIQLIPDPQCQIITAYPGNNYLGSKENKDPAAPPVCFKTIASGLGTGFSGLTIEPVLGIDRVQTATPSTLEEKDIPPIPSAKATQTRQMFTGRTVLNTPYGKIFSAEAGAMSGVGSTEQAIIVDGRGYFAGATGHIYAFGDFIGINKKGSYVGEICLKR
ncbi:hypothetical protein ACUHMQ_00610 [Chitinimonas sp. PSY-7]|uniref:hypothetical protein n=1 Tax=Chitinimonas sp. PSY-7 TaxID=3459088 RepID=UPI00403FCDF6